VIPALLFFPPAADADSILVNGSFETPDVPRGTFRVFTTIPGWITSFGSGIEVQDHVAGSPFEGEQFVELDSFANSGMIQTPVPTVAGQAYILSFAYSPRPGRAAADNGIDVFFNGVLLRRLAESGIGLRDTRWTLLTFTVITPGAASILEFRATGSSTTFGGYLDAVSLSAIPGGAQQPPTPTGFGSVPVDPSGIRLFWNATPTAASYRLAVTGPGLLFNQNVGNTIGVQGVRLPPGSYAALLFAVNQAGESQAPARHDFSIGCSPPGAVAPGGANPFTITKQGNTVTLNWPAAPRATEHILEVVMPDGGLLSLRTPVTTLFAANAPNGAYRLRVYGVNSCGNGPPTTPDVSLTIP
jgi:hypothetical protein